MKKTLSITCGLVLVLGLTGCEVAENPAKLNPIICTMDAKGCPDGSFVGRTGPNCEFAKCPGFKLKPDFVPTPESPIQLPENVITEKDCTAAGGEVWNTLGETSYNGELIGKIEELNCPCTCLVRNEGSDIIWVDVNGNLEEFAGNPDDIKTCIDYTYSNCPGSCVAKCISSSCSEPWIEDGKEMRNCTSDCDGPNSCIEKQNPAKNEIPKNCTSWFDGCNNCMVMKDGGLACTKMACKAYQKPKCLKFN